LTTAPNITITLEIMPPIVNMDHDIVYICWMHNITEKK
jgi:hypothetical protein